MADKYKLVRRIKQGAVNRKHRRAATRIALRMINGLEEKHSAARVLRTALASITCQHMTRNGKPCKRDAVSAGAFYRKPACELHMW